MTYELSETPEAEPGTSASARPSHRLRRNKVPEVTAYFWIIKVLCTTVGETAADLLNEKAGLGLTGVSVLMSALLAVVLVVQFRTKAYRAGVYWLAVALISVVGTLISDNLTDNMGVPLETTTAVFAVLLAVAFVVWYRRERTLSIHSIDTTSREAYYWLAVLFTFALGTAGGDLLSERMDLATGSLRSCSRWPSPPWRSRTSPWAWTRCGASGSPTSSPARSAPRSATTSPSRLATAASGSAPSSPAGSSWPSSSGWWCTWP